MRIYLTGFMGAGKTTVGGRLAGKLGWPLVDLDREIERRSAASIREIFAEHGEGVFRDLEHAALRDTERHPSVVVATGGGTIAFPRNLALLRRLGISVWIRPSFKTISERIRGPGKAARPLFRNQTQALELYRRRLEAYRAADVVIDVGPQEHAASVAERIILCLRERNCDI